MTEVRVALKARVKRVIMKSDRPMTPLQVHQAIGDIDIPVARVGEALRILYGEGYLRTAPVPDGNGYYDMGYVRRDLR